MQAVLTAPSLLCTPAQGTEYLNRLPREAAESPSMEDFTISPDRVPGNLLQEALLEQALLEHL